MKTGGLAASFCIMPILIAICVLLIVIAGLLAFISSQIADGVDQLEKLNSREEKSEANGDRPQPK